MSDPVEPAVVDPVEPATDPAPEAKWYDSISDADLRSNPTMQKYNTQEDQMRGHLELAKSLGSDRVAWPKGENDKAGWDEINKRMGVPEKPEGYELEPFANPSGVELIDRIKFQESMLESGASKKTAQSIWNTHVKGITEGYAKAQADFEANVTAAKNELMQEWGEAYEPTIKRNEHLIDTLASSQDEKDFLTATLAQDAKGQRFLSKISQNYAEHSINGFQEKANFTLTPDQARVELDTIRKSSDYQSDDIRVRQPLIDRSNDLMRMIKAKR